MQYVDLIYVYSVEWLLLPSNMLLPHIPAVFIAIFLFICLYFCGRSIQSLLSAILKYITLLLTAVTML